jgi:hypothetical protein
MAKDRNDNNLTCPKCKKPIDPTMGELSVGSASTNIEVQWECAKTAGGCGTRLYQFIELDPTPMEDN